MTLSQSLDEIEKRCDYKPDDFNTKYYTYHSQDVLRSIAEQANKKNEIYKLIQAVRILAEALEKFDSNYAERHEAGEALRKASEILK